jgi:hypothetical protein
LSQPTAPPTACPFLQISVGKVIYYLLEDAFLITSCYVKDLFTSTLDLELRKKLVKCYVCSIALYGAETWSLRAVDQKQMESFEMWCWRRMEKISWTDHVTGRRGRRRRKLQDDLKERRGYSHLKEEALDRTVWRAGFGRVFGPVVRQTAK